MAISILSIRRSTTFRRAVPAASTTTPAMDGTAAAGTGTTLREPIMSTRSMRALLATTGIINGDMRIDQRNNGAQIDPRGHQHLRD